MIREAFYYHGTKVSPEIAAVQGLRPARPEEVVERIRRWYGLGPAFYDDCDVLDAVKRKGDHLFVYLSDEFEMAAGYALRGSNFEGLVRQAAFAQRGLEYEFDSRPGYVYVVKLGGAAYRLGAEVRLPVIPAPAVRLVGVIVK